VHVHPCRDFAGEDQPDPQSCRKPSQDERPWAGGRLERALDSLEESLTQIEAKTSG